MPVVGHHPKGLKQLSISQNTKAECGNDQVHHEENEMTFIVKADALVYPLCWTMVIVLQNTFVANTAVVCSLWPDLVAPAATCRSGLCDSNSARGPPYTRQRAFFASLLRPQEAGTRFPWWIVQKSRANRAHVEVVHYQVHCD